MIIWNRPFLVFGERVTVQIQFQPHEINIQSDAKLFSTLDTLTVEMQEPVDMHRLSSSHSLGKSLRRMRSVESLHSSTSNLSLKSPTNLAPVEPLCDAAYAVKDAHKCLWTMPLTLSLPTSNEDPTWTGIVYIKVAIYEKHVSAPAVPKNNSFASQYLSSLLESEVSNIVEIKKIGLVEGHIEIRNLFNVELNAAPLQADIASVSVVMGKLVPGVSVQSWNFALSDANSTKFNTSKMEIVSHELFAIKSLDLKQAEEAFVFDYELQLVKEFLLSTVLEAPFRVIFDLSVSVDGFEDFVSLTFQCPIVLEELFKVATPHKETLAVTFETNTSEIARNSEFLFLVEIINRTKEEMKLCVFFPPPPALDVLMREEDVRGHVPGDVLMQYYHRQKTAQPAFFPLKDRQDNIVLKGNSCIKLSFPLISVQAGSHWIPPVRVYDQTNIMEFREYLSVNVKN